MSLVINQRSTLKEIASRAGVSISTASLVLSVRPGVRVAAETRRRVWQIARELHYRAKRPLQLRFLAGERSARPNVYERLAVVAAAQEQAERRGALLPVTYAGWTVEEQVRCIESLADGGVDGLLAATNFHPETVDRLLALRIPAVMVGATLADTRLSCVQADNQRGMVLLMEHLLSLGHRRIAFCGGGPDRFYEDHRHQVYLALLARAGALPPPRWTLWCDLDARGLEGWLQELRRLPPGDRPTALVADKAHVGRPLLAHLGRLGWTFPEEVSVVIFDDPCADDPEFPPVTCVRRPVEEIARLAVARLLEEIAEPGLPQVHTVLPVELIVRRSCGPPPAGK